MVSLAAALGAGRHPSRRYAVLPAQGPPGQQGRAMAEQKARGPETRQHEGCGRASVPAADTLCEGTE